MNIRLDQTVTFTVDWRDSFGNPAPAPADITPFVGDPAYLQVEDLGDGVFKVTPLARVDGDSAGVHSAIGSVSDVVNVAGGAATSGAIVWGTPTPA